MTLPANPLLTKVREWIALADEDLLVAGYLLTLGPDCPYRMVAYHAQQCAEKYLKSYLVLKNVDFPFTHNIARLRELCIPFAKWAEDLFEAEELSPFAITTRYPGVALIVTELEAIEALRIAETVKFVVQHGLRVEGVIT